MHRTAMATALLGVLAILVTGATSGARTATPDSGVRGRVLVGPTCPVQRVGQSCERPARTLITVAREPSGRMVARVRSGSDGRFRVAVRAGRYRLTPAGGNPLPRSVPADVTVVAHRFTAVTLRLDTGIR